MTLADLMRALARRWPIVAAGLVVTLGLAYLSTRVEPVYHSRTEIVFLAPTSVRNPNELVTSSESLIITAGVVAKRINGAGIPTKYGSPFVNQVGAPSDGEHTWIQLLDNGTQWASAFDDQLLVVNTVGSTPEEVSERTEAALALVRTELAELETEFDVDPINDISTRMSPDSPIITEISGSAMRAAGMTLVVGGVATVALVVILETVAAARRESSVATGSGARQRRAGWWRGRRNSAEG